MTQRILDIIFAGLAIFTLSPVLVPVIILLRLTGEGEIFFAQQRVGKNGKLFSLLKFATMLKDSPNIGPGTVTLKNDPRVLPFGKVLRKTKVNELPQLINVIKGEMSIVGPRPQTLRCFGVFLPEHQIAIKNVRPGLSGLGSIVFRDEERILSNNNSSIDFYDHVIAPFKGEIESYYVDSQSISTYTKVILATVWVILFPKSKIIWKIFPNIPTPPTSLQHALNF